MVSAVHREGNAVDLEDLDHAAPGRNGDERVGLAIILQSEPVGIRMRVAGIDGFDAELDSGLGEHLRGSGKALVVGLPA